MIECILSIDYEIYGNGDGSLQEHVHMPAKRLAEILNDAGAKIVLFFEAAEMEAIEAQGTDPAIGRVRDQVRELYQQGHEIALHLHPQWYNASYRDAKWSLDYGEYNLCNLSEARISEVVDRSIEYTRNVLGSPDYSPFSFRAGNWLFQPCRTVARVLSERGVRIDSSVFKWGLQHEHGLDYRRAARNGYFWRFKDDVNKADPSGTLIEIPIYTQSVPFWKIATKKRLGLQKTGSTSTKTAGQKLFRLLDMARLWYPLKFDFCRMTGDELIRMTETVIKEDDQDPGSFRPLVAIGHTKDLRDFGTVKLFLNYLEKKNIKVTTFNKAYTNWLSNTS